VGCAGKCGKNPCKNGGVCTEGYDHFTCDCRWTPFKGPICADEIGVNMRTNYMIKYDFKGNYKSTIAEKIHVGFTTTDPKGFLIGAYSDIRCRCCKTPFPLSAKFRTKMLQNLYLANFLSLVLYLIVSSVAYNYSGTP
jgi:hypothetical protein